MPSIAQAIRDSYSGIVLTRSISDCHDASRLAMTGARRNKVEAAGHCEALAEAICDSYSGIVLTRSISDCHDASSLEMTEARRNKIEVAGHCEALAEAICDIQCRKKAVEVYLVDY